MALLYPRDMTSAYRWAQSSLKVRFRQELSRQAGGTPQGKDLGPALWVANYRTVTMRQQDAEALHADFDTLGGLSRPFYLHPFRRPWPASVADPATVDLDGVTVQSIRGDNAAFRLTGLEPNLVLTSGDFVSIAVTGGGTEFVKLATGGTVAGTGLSPWVEVVPHLRASVQVGDVCTLKMPLVEMRLEPETLDMPKVAAGLYAVAFRAVQDVR